MRSGRLSGRQSRSGQSPSFYGRHEILLVRREILHGNVSGEQSPSFYDRHEIPYVRREILVRNVRSEQSPRVRRSRRGAEGGPGRSLGVGEEGRSRRLEAQQSRNS
jgi:hypothetical protein